MSAKLALFVALGLFTVFYLGVLVRGARQARVVRGERGTATPGGVLVGFVTNFLDTLGVGSFATTTAIWRQWRMVPDERIPGTLNFGHTLPTIAQAFIFTTLVPVGSKTLIAMIAAAVLGSWVGAGVVSSWPRRRIQIGMGFALIVMAAIMAWRTGVGDPTGGDKFELDGTLFVLGLVGNFVLGALMTLGIGLYAPCMILVSLLGLNPKAAFPIMMGSCAFLMPVASARFVREQKFDLRAALGLLIGGIPAALIAGLLVKSLPLTAVKWIVVVVVIYTATTLLLAARKREAGEALGQPAPVPNEPGVATP
jgi:uncharacterized membrane protein YfcA